MSKASIDKRLADLEQQAQEMTSKGIRIFTQSQEDKDIYFESEDGPAWTPEQIHEVAQDGWTVLRITYNSEHFKGGHHA